MSHVSRVVAIFLLTLLMPAIAAAQDTIELSETQRGFNEKGVSAIREGKYPLAISSFESSLTLGEANVTYLNLGRAYQRAGDCMLAKQAYGKVAAAPAVVAPSREEILTVLAKYSGELPAVCPATVKVICADPGATVSVDGGEAQPCSPSVDLEVTPGDRSLTASAGDRTLQQDVSPQEGERVEVVIVFPMEQQEPDPKPDPTPTPETTPDPGLVATAPTKKSPVRMVGLVTAAVGAATLTTGLILDVTYVADRVRLCSADPDTRDCTEQSDYEAARNAQRANSVVFAVGGGLAIGGAILYLVGGLSDGGVSLQFDGGPGIAWTTRF